MKMGSHIVVIPIKLKDELYVKNSTHLVMNSFFYLKIYPRYVLADTHQRFKSSG